MHWKSNLLGVMLHQREGWTRLSNRHLLSLIIRLGQGIGGDDRNTATNQKHFGRYYQSIFLYYYTRLFLIFTKQVSV